MYYIIRNVGLRISYLTWLNYLASELPICFMKYEEKKIEIEDIKQHQEKGWDVFIVARRAMEDKGILPFLLDDEGKEIEIKPHDLDDDSELKQKWISKHIQTAIEPNDLLFRDEEKIPNIKYFCANGGRGAAALLITCANSLGVHINEREIVDIIRKTTFRKGGPTKNPKKRYNAGLALLTNYRLVFSTNLVERLSNADLPDSLKQYFEKVKIKVDNVKN